MMMRGVSVGSRSTMRGRRSWMFVAAVIALATVAGCFGGGGGGGGFFGNLGSGKKDKTAPTVVGTSPAASATSVPLTSRLTVTFSEPMTTATVLGGAFSVSSDGSPITGTVAYTDTPAPRMTFTPDQPLPGAATVTAKLTTAATDLAGNKLASALSF